MAKRNFSLKVEKTSLLKGRLKAPPSKSYTIRALICAGLDRKVKIINPLLAEDTQATMGVLKDLGARIRQGKDFFEVEGFAGLPSCKKGSLNVAESGTLLRLILPVIALGRGKFLVKAKGTLLKRTNKPIAEALLSLGVDIKGRDSNFRLPIIIDAKGEIPGGRVRVSGSLSSQTISSLLNIAPLAKDDLKIIVEDEVVSKPYIDITLDVLRQAGIKIVREDYREFFVSSGQRLHFKKDFTVHGDYSQAAFLIAASCLVKSDVAITDMVKDSQGDRRIINILNAMGAKIRHINSQVRIQGPSKLKGMDIDCCDTPDLVPILATVACFAKGKTRIFNISHLADKESNRIQSPAAELNKLGAKISAGTDALVIEGSVLEGRVVSGCNDHRMAMALAVAGLVVGSLTVTGAECINKSYPHFIVDMQSLGAKFNLEPGWK